MARTRSARVPKAKPAPITYQTSDAISSVAATLFARFEVHFNDLRQFRIAYVMVQGGREPQRDRIDGVWARFVKVPPLWKDLTGYDAVVWIREAVWKHLDEKQREALVAHELSHGGMSEKGALIVQRHDLEDFAFVARHWGDWHEGVALYGKQLSLFGKPDPKPDPHADKFADIDAKVADQKSEHGNVTPLRPRSTSSEQPQA